MFGRRITLFKLFDFEVRLDASWVVIAALVVWSLATYAFPTTHPGLTAGTYWGMALAAAVGFFASIVLHELCHSLVARRYDLPMKGITLFIFGGVAEMGGEPQSPKIEFLMAIAGPLASGAIGAICYLVKLAGQGSFPAAVTAVFSYLAWINWILAAFNLIPAFPLDGGRVLRAALWHFKGDLARATRIASSLGSAFGVVLMAYGVVQLFMGYLITAVWYFLIGMFVRGASRMSYEQMLLKSALQGEPVRRFMQPDPVTVRPGMSIHDLVENYIYRYNSKVYPVVNESGDLIGCVTNADVKQFAKEDWERHSVSELTKPCTAGNTVSPDTDALEAFSKIQESGTGRLLVTERNHLLGIISPEDLLRFMAAKMEMEGHAPARLMPRHP